MSGMTALWALARYGWLSSAAALMGSGDFMRLSRTLFPPVTLEDAPNCERRYGRWRRWWTTMSFSSWIN
ncbi:hypothetical protein [Sodalis sp.]|uniref:hypothetical protein n=1 Tax=Sodalis sp. (in: enterobacteria) TaxID=1898979 RepID=UPI003873CC1F